MTATGEKFPPLWKTLGPVLLLWIVLLLAMRWTRITDYQMADPDDFMRVVQIRDWMAGQSWFDVTQYRMNLPDGASMHWSRYIDVPVRIIIEILTPLTGQRIAEIAALAIIPLATLSLILFAVFKAILALTGEWKTALIGAALVPTNLLVFMQIVPLRIDHHGWQLAMASVALWAMVDRRLRFGPQIAGLALAFWMHVSIEGLPYAVAVGAIYGWFYFRERNRSLLPYMITLTIGSVFLLVSTRSGADLTITYCDAVSWPLLAALAAVTAAMWAGNLSRAAENAMGRAIIMGVAGAVGAALFLGNAQSCALDPFANLEPLVRRFWYQDISEGLGITHQHGLMIVLLTMIPALGLIGIYLGWKQQTDAEMRKRWLMMAAFSVFAFLMSMKLMRGGAVAEMCAMVGTAILVRAALDRIMQWRVAAMRILASVAAIFALSPVNALVIAHLVAPSQAQAKPRVAKTEACDLDKLAMVPKAYIFTAMGIGPAMLWRTHHSSYSSGYHRSHAHMNQIITAFTSDAETAKEIIIASGTDHVLFCSSLRDFNLYTKAFPDGLAAQLSRGDAPDWLERAPGMGRNQLWKIKRPAANSGGPTQ